MQDNFLFQHYLVIFVDHLGQRENLRKMTGLPTNETEKQQFIEITKSILQIIHIRDAFKNYFEADDSYMPNLTLVRPELRDAFLASQKMPALNFYGISDAMVIAVPLMSDDENCAAVNGIYHAFIATCGIGLLSLSVRVPLRAGLDVGVATQIDGKEIYGPALERAYYLESKLAEYPRFLVGKELINYLLWVENREFKTPLGEIAKENAIYCKGMIIQDTDGKYMLDFLGAKFKHAIENTIEPNLVASAFDFVIEQYKKYSKDENDKLAARYYRLLRYFQYRKSIWGIN
ncbi:MAG: hypothetical protein WC855_04030 [Thermodesulfovibrionales bacterium]